MEINYQGTDWQIQVLDRLNEDRDKILSPKGLQLKKDIPIEESIFYLGGFYGSNAIRCVLSKRGWKFQPMG